MPWSFSRSNAVRVRLRCAVLVAALVFATPAGASAQTGPVIRVATTLNDSGAEVFYALDKGFFEKAGLHVEIVTIASAGLLGSSVASGAVDIAETGISVIATAHQHGLPFVIIAPAGVYSSRTPTTGLIALKNAPFKTGADLAGKTIAVRDINSPAYVAARAWIDRNGGDSKSVKFVEIPDYDVAGALEAQRIDGAVIAEPDLQNAIAGGTFRMIAPVYNAIADEVLLGGYFTTAAYMQAHPDVVRTFAAVLAQTARWANKNQRESATILAKHAKSRVDPAMPRIAYTDHPTARLVQPMLDAAAAYGQLTSTFPAADLFAPGVLK
jgi:NitT/TauT family transport system substrate-binding protein